VSWLPKSRHHSGLEALSAKLGDIKQAPHDEAARATGPAPKELESRRQAMHMGTVLGANVLHRGVHGVEARIAICDDPSERQRRRLIDVDAILKAVSVHECKPLGQATLDLQTVAVGLLSTRDWPTRSATSSRCSAISHTRSAGRRAKPCSPMSRALGEETEKADHDGSKRLDKREASPFQSGSPE